MKLFAQKGFHSTSMKEIAEACGLGKSSLYNYFNSKDEIIIFIFQHHYGLLFDKIKQLDQNTSLSPKRRFVQHIEIQLEGFFVHKDFMRMQMREQIIRENEEIQHYLFKIRAEILNWNANRILSIYGEKVEPFVYDTATLLNGMIKEYLFYMIIDEKPLVIEEVANFLVKRVDSIVEGYSIAEKPILQSSLLTDLIEVGMESRIQAIHSLRKQWKHVENVLLESLNEGELLPEVESAIETIQSELNREKPTKIVLQSLLLYFGTMISMRLENELQKMQDTIDKYL